jgi:hydroxypyruvate reductase
MENNTINIASAQLADMRKDALAIFRAGLSAVDPSAAIKKHCRRDGNRFRVDDHFHDLSQIRHLYVVGAGKASAPMAAAIEEILGDRITAGTVTVKYGHTADLRRIGLVEAGHPVPDENGVTGAEKILSLVSPAGPDDLVICLISGGGSALLSLPASGITLADKQKVTKILLGCGATIHEINTLRKHLSRIKGGELSRAAHPATVIALILSDVVGDDLDVIASGPTVPDTRTFNDCRQIIAAYGIEAEMPPAVVNRIQAGIAGQIEETPKATDPMFSQTVNRIIGSNIDAIDAASREATLRGYRTLILSSMIEGDTTEAARMHGAIAREIIRTGHPIPAPACILSGGETTVKVRGAGKGGRNQEFALAAAMDIDGSGTTVVFSAGTDGTDGPTDAAGAVADHLTLSRARRRGMDPRHYLAENDAYHFFKPLNDLVITGPTKTNVMDLRVILVRSPHDRG